MKKIKIKEFEIHFFKKIGQKTIRLRLDRKGRILLSAPFLCSEKKATNFAESNLEWLRTQTQKVPGSSLFQAGQKIMLLGKTYTIIHTPDQKRGVFINEDNLYVSGSTEFLHRRIRDFAKKQLLNYIQEKAFEMAAQIHQKPAKITLRDTVSRWGSCSSKKNLSFCWKLALAPQYVIDYLIAHEVSHLQEMNHGKAFWETVALFHTQQAEAQIWLRRNGRELQKWK